MRKLRKNLLVILIATYLSSHVTHSRRRKRRPKPTKVANNTIYAPLKTNESLVCKVSKVFVRYSTEEEDEEYVCEMEQDGRPTTKLLNSVGLTSKSYLKLAGITNNFTTTFDKEISTNGVWLTMSNTKLIQNDTIQIQSSSVILKAEHQNRKLKRQNGVKTLLVIRVSTSDDTISVNSTTLSRHWFGGYHDKVNIASQMSLCSYHQLILLPASGPAILNGVLDIKLSIPALDSESNHLMALAEQVAYMKYDLKLSEQYDLLAFCLPTKARHNNRNFIAYAWQHGFRSIYKNEWCSSISTQMHEIGHSLGLAHSGVLHDSSYMDLSCYMGYAMKDNDVPKQCFNSIKSWQLGWYADKTLEIFPLKENWNGKIIGVVDYGRAKNEVVILKVAQPQLKERDLYLSFNRKKTFNQNVRLYGDQVVLTQGELYQQSYVVTAMSQGDIFRIKYFDDSTHDLIFYVKTINIHSHDYILDYAVVEITLDTCFNTTCDDFDKCTFDSCHPTRGCQNTPRSCDDDDACTADSCSEGLCVYDPIEFCQSCNFDQDCQDDFFCNGREICRNGICHSINPPCHDFNEFTKDVCLEDLKKCRHEFEILVDSTIVTIGENVTLEVLLPNKYDFYWFVNDELFGNDEFGTISTTGIYTAPSRLPSNTSIFIHAIHESLYSSILLTLSCPAIMNNNATIELLENTAPVLAGTHVIYTATIKDTICTDEIHWSIDNTSMGNLTKISSTQVQYKPPLHLTRRHEIITITVTSSENTLLRQSFSQIILPACHQVPTNNLILFPSHQYVQQNETIEFSAYCHEYQNISWSSTTPFGKFSYLDNNLIQYRVPSSLNSTRIRILATSSDNKIGKAFLTILQ